MPITFLSKIDFFNKKGSTVLEGKIILGRIISLVLAWFFRSEMELYVLYLGFDAGCYSGPWESKG